MENGKGGRVCDSGISTPVDSLISSSSKWRIGSDSDMEEVLQNGGEGEAPEEPSELMQDLSSNSLQESEEARGPDLKQASRRHTLHSLRMASVDVPCCGDGVGGCSMPASPRVSASAGHGRLSMPSILRNAVTRSASFDQGGKGETHHGWMSLKVNSKHPTSFFVYNIFVLI